MVSPTSIHSPLLLSPYATLQLPPSVAAPAGPLSLPSTSSTTDATTTFVVNELLSPAAAGTSGAETQRYVIRSQLEQAQQQAQVAACQVQMLRDQLCTETTARLEAQSKTHQLLNSNREVSSESGKKQTTDNGIFL